jgi:hypothetical protein
MCGACWRFPAGSKSDVIIVLRNDSQLTPTAERTKLTAGRLVGAAVFCFVAPLQTAIEPSPFEILLRLMQRAQRAKSASPAIRFDSDVAPLQTAPEPSPFEILLRLMQRAEARKSAPPAIRFDSDVAPLQTAKEPSPFVSHLLQLQRAQRARPPPQNAQQRRMFGDPGRRLRPLVASVKMSLRSKPPSLSILST